MPNQSISAKQFTLDENGSAVLLVRFRPGTVGERDRVVHLVPVRPADGIPGVLVARCGVRFRPGQAEPLDHIGGMPCERCLAAPP